MNLGQQIVQMTDSDKTWNWDFAFRAWHFINSL